ncbi:MAG: hypothetical protein R3F17_15785 [Planctomycetota bacterium]
MLAGYSDALGVRCFAEAVQFSPRTWGERAAVDARRVRRPIQPESAVSHPCQALADWKTLDDCGVPRGGKFVLSWAYHPKALPLAVPASTVKMAAQRGMDVTVLRPEGFGLPAQVMDEARRLAQASGGRVRESHDRAESLEGAHVLYAKSWQSPQYYGDATAEAALRAPLRDWCVTESWFAPAEREAILMHCLPVRRNVVVHEEVLDGPRSRVLPQANNRLHAQKALLLEMLT